MVEVEITPKTIGFFYANGRTNTHRNLQIYQIAVPQYFIFK